MQYIKLLHLSHVKSKLVQIQPRFAFTVSTSSVFYPLFYLWSLLVIPDLVKITNMKRRVLINQQVFNPMKYSGDINWVLADRFFILRDEKKFYITGRKKLL